jgi:hypothetical protein
MWLMIAGVKYVNPRVRVLVSLWELLEYWFPCSINEHKIIIFFFVLLCSFSQEITIVMLQFKVPHPIKEKELSRNLSVAMVGCYLVFRCMSFFVLFSNFVAGFSSYLHNCVFASSLELFILFFPFHLLPNLICLLRHKLMHITIIFNI